MLVEKVGHKFIEMELNQKEEDIGVKNEMSSEKIEESQISNDSAEIVEYSDFAKSDFVNLLKELKKDNDLNRVVKVLREIKYHINKIQDLERAVALNRFIELGSDAEDFHYRPDVMDVAIEADLKHLRVKTTAHLKELEAKKDDNLAQKESLLNELRQLVESTDDKHSFNRFKEIQDQWNSIGPIPHSRNRSIWASYHALVELFYDNRNIYFELKELDRKKNFEAKTKLCERAEKIVSLKNINEAIRELDNLHEEYKRIGPVANEEKEPLWDRFKKASKSIHERRDARQTELYEEQLKNLDQKIEIVNSVEQYATFQSDKISDWNKKTVEILELQKKWDKVKGVPQNKAREVSRKFWAAFKLFFKNKGLAFKESVKLQNENLSLKMDLIKRVDEIKESEDWEKTSNELRHIQNEWKKIGPVSFKDNQRVYLEFKSSCDYFFDRLRAKRNEDESNKVENLKNKEELCKDLEKMVSEKIGTLDDIKKLSHDFNNSGGVPNNSNFEINNRFEKAVLQWLNSVSSASEEEKAKIKLQIELDGLKTDSDAENKIHKRVQILKRKISHSENEFVTLKNNLEFFSFSKKSENLKNEFNQKLEVAEQNLNKMKQELKLLYDIARKNLQS